MALLVQHSGGGQVHHLQDGKSGPGEDQPQNVNTAVVVQVLFHNSRKPASAKKSNSIILFTELSFQTIPPVIPLIIIGFMYMIGSILILSIFERLWPHPGMPRQTSTASTNPWKDEYFI